ncbi:MAG: hypothetical protein ABI859_06950 [Pseudomonadota bacterium]
MTRQDRVLVAQLQSTYALCLYDAVEESGALLHLRVGPPGRATDPELTDTSLTTDLMLLDRCLSELRRIDGRAKHLQAKVVGQIEDGGGAHERFDAIEKFLTAYLADADVHLVSCYARPGAEQLLRFRPAMGQLRCEAVPRSQ